MPMDPDLRRQVTRAVLMVTGIAVVLGLVVALTATAALRMAGVSGDDGPAPSVAAPEPELPTPDTVESSPTPSPTPSPSPTETTPSPTESRSAKPTPKPRQIRLRAGASAATAMEEVTLSGRYPGGNGSTLQVQRREGGAWVPFPTSATVEGGTFETYVALGQPGPNRMRVVDTSTGRTSNVVVIDVS